MYSLHVNQSYTDQNGETVELDPLNLHLVYPSHTEARRIQLILEQVYGEGRVEISAVQEYQARMGRY